MMGPMDIIKTLCTACLIVLLQSCTIKEDRGPCPCHLNVDISNCYDYTERIMLSAWRYEAENLFTDKIKLKDYPGMYTRKVDKGSLYVCAISGYDSMVIKNGTAVIPEGEDCPEVMAYKGGMLDASGDSADEKVTLHKQYSRIRFLTDEQTENMGDLTFRVTGNVNGFDLSTLTPVIGSFNALALKDEDGIRSLIVPRQNDDDLTLEIYKDGVLYGTVGIGEEIRDSGYSWEDEDLRDIYLTISLFSSSGVLVDVNGWDTVRVRYII